MRKIVKGLWVTALIMTMILLGTLLADKQILRNDLIRLHVVANSDSARDQQVKLLVRDAVLKYVTDVTKNVDSASKAETVLSDHLAMLRSIGDSVLRENCVSNECRVSLTDAYFNRREYETFMLPSGYYRTLKIEIGEAEGENWWCVAFPGLCLPASQEEFESVAAASGFDSVTIKTMEAEDGYEVRFFLLDCLGKLEKFLKIS